MDAPENSEQYTNVSEAKFQLNKLGTYTLYSVGLHYIVLYKASKDLSKNPTRDPLNY